MLAIPILLTCQMLADMTHPLIVDVRSWDAYSEAHIPGAIRLDADTLSSEQDGAGNMLRPVDELTALLEEAGVDPDRFIVIYGANETIEDLMSAARLFWILDYLGYGQVAVLNGGFAEWTAQGRDVAAGATRLPPAEVSGGGVQERLLATFDEVRLAMGDDSVALIDVRPESFYAGEEKKDYVAKAGHIPGAVNLPLAAMLEGKHLLVKDPETIGAVLEERLAPVSGASRAILYCNSGNTSALGYLILRHAQGEHAFTNIAIYDGSMRHWTAKGGETAQLEAAPGR